MTQTRCHFYNIVIQKPNMFYFTFYSKTNCSYCVKAMNAILAIIGDENADKINVINDPPQAHVDVLKLRHNHYTYPFIFVGDKFVGGFDGIVSNSDMIEAELDKQFNFEPMF